MDHPTKATGKMINKTDMESRNGQTTQATQVISKMGRKMEKENLLGLMALTIKGISTII